VPAHNVQRICRYFAGSTQVTDVRYAYASCPCGTKSGLAIELFQGTHRQPRSPRGAPLGWGVSGILLPERRATRCVTDRKRPGGELFATRMVGILPGSLLVWRLTGNSALEARGMGFP
jgi:hypothetical protein